MEQGKTGKNEKRIVQLAVGVILFGSALLSGENVAQPYLYLASYVILGWKVIYNAARNFCKGKVFDENFLMAVATAGAFVIGEFPEAVAVVLFYLAGEYLQDLAVFRSKKSISDLMDIKPDFATVEVDGELVRVGPDTVNVGDAIVVRPGEKIPLDGIVLDGKSMLDTKALTGESVPRKVKAADTVFSGCINQNGVLTIEATKPFGESTVSKIIDLIENVSSKKTPTENFITTFFGYYTPAVISLAFLFAVLPPLFFGGIWVDWIYRALVFLVISCPCALIIAIPLGFFGGIGGASRNGVLVKGSGYLEALGNLDIVVFDKTGTLTKGVFEVTDIQPADGIASEKLLEYAAYAEAFSTHPIALSIMAACGDNINKDNLADYTEIPGQGVSVRVNGVTVLAGNGKLMRTKNVSLPAESCGIGTKVYIAVGGKYAGCIVISDKVKEDSGVAIANLKDQGVRKTVMLTGDDEYIAEVVAEKLSLDEVHSRLLPDQKVEIVEKLDEGKRAKGKLAFVGDGINDAPVLARADVGVAMGGLGSDAAIEAADVVLMTDEPSKLVDAIKIAKRTKHIIWQDIIFALGIKILFLVLGASGLAGMWEAVFADMGVSILAILNTLRVMKIKL